MLNIIMAFAAGAALSAVIGLFEKNRLYREAGTILLAAKAALENAQEEAKNDEAHIKALRAEIRELTGASSRTSH